MGTGWRRVLCTSVHGDHEAAASAGGAERHRQQQRCPSPSPSPIPIPIPIPIPSPKLCLGSNPSTPRPRLRLRCRTTSKSPPASSDPCSPVSAVSVSVSPSRFALFKATLGLGLSRIRCGICSQSVKARQGAAAVFTAECSHAFHFPCIAAHIRAGHARVCPICSAAWHHAPLLSSFHHQPDPKQAKADARHGKPLARGHGKKPHSHHGRLGENKEEEEEEGPPAAAAAANLKVYDDDEPLLRSPTGCSGGHTLFDPIPEVEDEDGDGDEECSAHSCPSSVTPSVRTAAPVPARSSGGGVEVEVMPVAALVSAGRRKHHDYVVPLKVRAPPLPHAASAPLLDPTRRAPIDLVTVLDLGENMTGDKVQMLKRAMRLLISSLGPADRLAVVAFSSKAAKRLAPLRRMSPQGQRSARQIVDRIVVCSSQGQSTCVGEAIRKATKILQDRRECNPVATIMLLSDGQHQHQHQHQDDDSDPHHQSRQRWLPTTAMTRFAHLEIPIHDSGLGVDAPRHQKQRDAVCMGEDDAFTKSVSGLLSVVLQEVHLQLIFPSGEISVVYSCGGRGGCRALALGGGGSCSVRLGDLYAEEERELLVELRVPASHRPPSSTMSLRCSYRDPGSRQLIRCGEQSLPLPPLHGHHEPQRVEWLRNLFVTVRAVAESQRLAELNELATASHLLSSARSLLLQSRSPSNNSLVHRLEAELMKIQLCRQQQQSSQSSSHRRRSEQPLLVGGSDGGGEPLTPTSAWRAAERLAKVAIMRKSLNRVSDLHGFENARF